MVWIFMVNPADGAGAGLRQGEAAGRGVAGGAERVGRSAPRVPKGRFAGASKALHHTPYTPRFKGAFIVGLAALKGLFLSDRRR